MIKTKQLIEKLLKEEILGIHVDLSDYWSTLHLKTSKYSFSINHNRKDLSDNWAHVTEISLRSEPEKEVVHFISGNIDEISRLVKDTLLNILKERILNKKYKYVLEKEELSNGNRTETLVFKAEDIGITPTEESDNLDCYIQRKVNYYYHNPKTYSDQKQDLPELTYSFCFDKFARFKIVGKAYDANRTVGSEIEATCSLCPELASIFDKEYQNILDGREAELATQETAFDEFVSEILK